MDANSLPKFDGDGQSFGAAKMAAIGGRALPNANGGTPPTEGADKLTFSQAKLESIGGASLPKPQQGASTLEVNDIGNVDKLGAFPN